eukprot:SM000407S15246  [mRNA]  locus=s407:43228:44375:+ [translate_table: standard]
MAALPAPAPCAAAASAAAAPLLQPPRAAAAAAAASRCPVLPDVAATPLPQCPEGSTVSLSIGGDCGLGVSVYPDFVYRPVGGGGEGTATDCDGGRIAVTFDAATLNIPSVTSGTTSLLGVPLPPPLRIDIRPQSLSGFVDRDTGKVELGFKARFFFSAGPLYEAPPLLVDTVLTTEESRGAMRSGHGQRLDGAGRCRLVGTARVPPVDDIFLTNFLMLPTDVLAELPCRFLFSSPEARTDLQSGLAL